MNLRDIKLRIRGVRKTQQITRAMKMVAAVKFRHAQARLLGARPYAARIRELTARALSQWHAACPPCDIVNEPHPLLRRHADQRLLLFVVASDKGLCGSFNSNVFKTVYRFLKEHATADNTHEVGLFLVGRKTNDFFKRFHALEFRSAIYQYIPQAEADYISIGKHLIELYTGSRFDRIDAFFTEFKSALHNRVVHEQLLPLVSLLPETGQRTKGDELSEPSMTEILSDLIPRFLFTRIHQILMESEASEQGTRMNMMDQATRNADDLIAQLTLDFNKARQWGITRELSDITTGVEAMA